MKKKFPINGNSHKKTSHIKRKKKYKREKQKRKEKNKKEKKKHTYKKEQKYQRVREGLYIHTDTHLQRELRKKNSYLYIL